MHCEGDSIRRPRCCSLWRAEQPSRTQGRDKHNAAGGKGGKLAFVEARKRGQFEFVFIGKQSKYRVIGGALFPMIAAFRWLVANADLMRRV